MFFVKALAPRPRAHIVGERRTQRYFTGASLCSGRCRTATGSGTGLAGAQGLLLLQGQGLLLLLVQV